MTCPLPSGLQYPEPLFLARTIRLERNRAHLTQEQLAEKAGLTRNYIGNIERAERKIALETLGKIARALKCRIPDLVRDL
ncbi:MAG TPA: helix-turn-helix transcriptional regulator [Candidatus Binatia bacterium]|jgi:transcriptional regulator with XRE-family HTH domain|nr:helix-turn-helix transcriptional regulator [Candidatus Binatia bacterium]